MSTRIHRLLGRLLATLVVAAGLTVVATPVATAAPPPPCGVPGNLVQNCGFETGDFTGWDVDPVHYNIAVRDQGHLGSHAAWFGSTVVDDKISQAIQGTTPGKSYVVRFWLRVQTTNNHFAASVDTGTETVPITEVSYSGGFGWTLFTGSFVAGTDAPVLRFAGRNTSNFDYLDDIAVTPAADNCSDVVGNLIGNCGWEAPLFAPWVPVPVSFNGYGVAPVGGHSGPQTAYLSSTLPADDVWTQPIQGTSPGTTYLVQLWVRDISVVDAANHLRIDVQSTAAGTVTLAELTDEPSFDWTLFTGSFVAGATAPTLSIAGRAADGTYSLDDVTVTAADPAITMPSTLPHATYATAYAEGVSATGGTAPYTYEVTAGDLPPGLVLNPSTGAISGAPTAAGDATFTITATDAAGFTGAQAYTLTVDKMVPSLGITGPSVGGVVGETAAITHVATPGGTLTYASSTPGTCSVDGPTVTYLHSGSCTIALTRETDANYLARTVDLTVGVGQAATTTALTVAPHQVVADVEVAAPGAGSPTGTVTFLVDGNPVGTAPVTSGTATLAYTVPAGMTRQVSAVYAGDADFTGSADSTTRHDPAITAAVASTLPKNAAGWYRTPVTVTFTCTPNGAPLTAPCPAPVVLATSGAAQSVTRTILATDGGVAMVAVSGLHIDRTVPRVRVTGVRNGGVYGGAPRMRCAATDAHSGVASCRLTRHTRGTVTSYVATATDRAGNRASVRGSYRVPRVHLAGVPFARGAWQVRTGQSYTLVVTGTRSRPSYVNAAPVPARPSGFGGYFRKVGPSRWEITVTMRNLGHDRTWNLGVRYAEKLHLVRVHTR
ncbi:MAG: Ig-like domain repeat protein [Nocardioidaceae bacterium]|nr:Ig-like domain repeat protein [Nocardioidaceae bacterium]